MKFVFAENEGTELKESVNRTFLKAVSAFANFNSGTIYFGVKDNGEVMGIANPEETRLNIENTINDNMKPVPRYQLSEQTVNGKTVIKLNVYKGNETPYLYKNRAYKRMDTASVPCDDFALRKLLLSGMNIRYEELPYRGEKPKFTVLERKMKETVGIEELSSDVMKTLGLYVDGEFNNAAAFLADHNSYRACGIDMVRFGNTENVFLDRVTVEKQSLLKQYDAALAFFDKWYAPYEEVSGFFREKRIYIPREAFREAVVNGLCHRDFSMNAQIRVACYENRIEITSPGGLPEGITRDEFLNGAISSLRNETVSEVFYRLNLIEKFATGIKRIRKEYEPFAEKPEFMISENIIIVVLPKIDYTVDKNKNARELQRFNEKNNGHVHENETKENVNETEEANNETKDAENEIKEADNETKDAENETKDAENETEEITEQIEEKSTPEIRKKKIVSAMKADSEMTMDQLAEILGVSRSTVGRDIAELKRNGIINRRGGPKTGVWVVTSD